MSAVDIVISVVLVCYDQEKYIAQALDSVLMQKTEFPFEIIVGDDASTDRTPEIIMQRCSQHPGRIRFIRREENLGATRNAYELMQLCRGRFIAYIEGDDYWTDEHKLQKQTKFLLEHPDYLGCTSRFSVVDSDGRELKGERLEWVRQKKRFSFSDFDGWHLPGQSSTYLRRNIYQYPEFDYSVMYKADRTIGDRISAMIYLMHGDYYCFDEKMSAYRIPDRSRKCGTVDVYSDPVAALKRDLEIYKKLKDFTAQRGMKLKSDYAARRIYYSAVIRRLHTRSPMLKEIQRESLSLTDSALRTILLFPAYVFERLSGRLKAHYHK